MYSILNPPLVVTWSVLKWTKTSLPKIWSIIKNTVKSNLAIKNGLVRNKLVLRNHFPWRICHFLNKDKELLALRNNFGATKKFLIAKFWHPWMITLKVLWIAYLPRTCRVLSETAVKYFWTFKFLRVKNPSVLLSSLVQSCSSLPSSKFVHLNQVHLWLPKPLNLNYF